MKQESYFERIHHYLSGDMDDADKTIFEQEMKRNSKLEEDVRFEKQLLKGMEWAGDEELKQTIKKAHRQLQEKGFFDEGSRVGKPDVRLFSSNRNKLMAAAAAILLLLAATWWFFGKQRASVADEVFAQYFQPETVKLRAIITGLEAPGFAAEATAQDSLREALVRYQEGQYGEAALALIDILAHHPQNDTASFYLALLQVGQNNFDEAITVLELLAESGNFPFKNEAKWYLGLCLLKTEEHPDKAIAIFRELANQPGYPNNKAARDILSAIAPNG